MVMNDYNVFDYIKHTFNMLHSTGQNYVVENINEYIKSRQT
jgi:hypothetical protein